jgi:N-acetylglucosamine malate deacetylase 1
MSKKILALAPHPDDVEFGCGGTIRKYIEAGAEVWYLAFSPCNKSLPPGLRENQIYDELSISAQALGIREERIKKLNFEVRVFPSQRQNILELLYQENKDLKPDLVFLPSTFDIHQDHQVISQEGIRAFKNCSILGYELPWNNLGFNHNHYSILNNGQIEKKIEALACYKSQKERKYSDPNFIKGLARLRGIQAGSEFAEGFELIRWIE